jgi:3-(3-hydroxy-phenyl)propionate hydroxylase
MKNKNYDIFIVGMGPVGLFAANVFGHYGYRVRVIEQFPKRVTFPRAIVIDSEVLRCIQSVGLLDKILPILRADDGLRLINYKGDLMAHFKTTEQDGHSASNYLFYQPELEDMLENGVTRFSNVEKTFGWAFQSIEQNNADGVVFTCKNTETGDIETISSRFLLGCDGANSTIRRLLDIKVEKLNYEGAILKIDVTDPTCDSIPFQNAEQFCSATFPYIRMSGKIGHKRFEFPLIYDPNPEKETYQKPEKINELLAKVGEDASKLRLEHVILYKYQSQKTEIWQKGNIILAGDAAHLTPPFIGQGMCAGFRDIINISWKTDELLRGVSQNTLLDSFQSEREPNFSHYLQGAFLVGDAYVSDWETMPFPTPPDKILAAERPPLGEGFFTDTVGSRHLFPQIKVSSEGNTIMSDDYFGKKWTLLTLKSVSKTVAKQLADKRIQHFVLSKDFDTSGILRGWLDKHQVTCVLLRPDKYVFGTGKSASKLVSLC